MLAGEISYARPPELPELLTASSLIQIFALDQKD